MTIFRGLCAFPITPCQPDGEVDVSALRRLLERLVDAGVDSIGLLGSTGSYAYLSRPQRRRCVEAAVDVTRGRVPLLVGVGALRTDEAVGLAEDAHAAGADALLLAPVSYIPLQDEEVFEHFRAVAAATPRPLCVYNNPGTTHFSFTPELLGRLSGVPRIVAAKNPAAASAQVADQHAQFGHAVAADFSLGYSVDWHAGEALIAGGTTWYSVAAGLFPQPCLQIVHLVQAGRYDEARQAHARLEPLWALFRAHSSYRVIHAAAALLGLGDGEPPRPLRPVDDAVRAQIGATMERLALD